MRISDWSSDVCSSDLAEVRARLESSPALLGHGPDYVLHAILDFIVDGYFPVIDAIEDRLLLVEDSVMDTPLDAQEIRHLYATRHAITSFQRIAELLKYLTRKLVMHQLPGDAKQGRSFFRDGRDHVQRAATR